MGGFTFATERGGPIAFATVNMGQRRLIFDAMTEADVGWVVRGDDCPDCLYTQVTKASAIHSLKKARAVVEKDNHFFDDYAVRWSSGRASYEVFFAIVDVLLEELETLEEDTIEILDDLAYCEHEAMGKRKRKRRVKRCGK